MFPFILRDKAFRLQSLPLGAFLLATATSARAQNLTKPQPSGVETPQLTSRARPASAIATPVRPSFTRRSRGLLMALPEPNNSAARVSRPAKGAAALSTPAVIAVGNSSVSGSALSGGALSRSSTPGTEIAAAQRVKVATKTRFAASQVAVQPVDLKTVPVALSSSLPGTASIATTAAVPVAPSTSLAPSVSRPRGSHLPSRGGLVPGVPVEVRPSRPDNAPINDSQRRLLAQLDAELGVAQRRLNRAETRLSEGQKQLGSFNDVLRSAMLDAGDDARGLHPFVRVAQRYMGTPYVWGGESARGFDCSGFIMRVMRDLGYRALPHSAAEQFRYGLPIAKPLLKAGDVVFFANTYKPGISHVGIYLGRGRFIHAANSKVGTIVSNLNDAKWVEHYAGARRLLPIHE
ncbi:Cell wall-associated hydrolase, NlpC family [Abditibacterium utsteinense]|uniref:Cell wall-associated hydrolase, NlpC family n=1 Tax=Abditibacterium utsteinense TaxID=1960156 RepID=A0A2S8SWV7_9BACT|nr:C40 family peptidase [Abditibacterium utsteinense]PQV65280.1 Cell wall-associated hydrolase, NlpC family [Abditibacterium utsteinense]